MSAGLHRALAVLIASVALPASGLSWCQSYPVKPVRDHHGHRVQPWFAMFAPRDTPPVITAKWQKVIAELRESGTVFD